MHFGDQTTGWTRRQRPWAVWLLALAICLQAASPARAWGRSGHRAAAKIAEARLSPAARAAVRELLEPGESLADASTWADEVRRDMPETAPWHYVNTPINDAAHYDSKYCPEAGCVVAAITAQRSRLADRSLPRVERQKALRFLVHFIEDLHQPLHVGDRKDRGGNDLQLQFFEDGSNLHRIWDSGIMNRFNDDEEVWKREIDALANPENTLAWSKGSVPDWAEESFQLAKRAYQPPGRGSQLNSGDKLSDDYQKFAIPIVRERLAQSGVRVAMVLNDVLK
jgi:nuclease S1